MSKTIDEIMQENPLLGRILSVYHSVLNFSRRVNWSSRKAYAIVNGKQEPTCKDIEVICNALDIEIPSDMRLLFFS